MSTKKTPEQIVAELRADSANWVNYWSDYDEDDEVRYEPEIGLDGSFTLDQLRAIVAVREKELFFKKGTTK